ncbi:leucyl aminopeptidase family protein [Oceanobacillus timonensis]|uniref:leucyl aminopeptidase family protein n=1 Tax=Oceanobacillus timonensis TaxID=1926285 RepID=UPI0009BC2F0A|nr:leucyl aminopeptidase family protein [Oceanobacillus timonensis]
MQIHIVPVKKEETFIKELKFGQIGLLQKENQMYCYLGLGISLLSFEDIRLLGGFAWKELAKLSSDQIQIDFSSIVLQSGKLNKQEVIQCFMEGWHLAAYQFITYQKESHPLPVLQLVSEEENFENLNQIAQDKANAVHFTRDLCNEPANKLTPTVYAEKLRQEFAETDVKVEIIEDETLLEIDFPGIHAVAKGSSNPPKLVVLTLNRAEQKEKIALVGKGVTFDSGGINAKSGSDIGEMKMDMAGSAAVAGAMKLLEKSKTQVNIVAVIPMVQNLADGNAMLPSDVIRYRNGIHVEIGNTDAEGRLILADGMLYAQEVLGAKKVIDIATLTGSIGGALGLKAAGIFSNDESALWDYKQLGEDCGDYVWPLPVYEDYMLHLQTDVADVNNMSNTPYGGSIMAALFLKQFMDDTNKWVHIDMANRMTPHKIQSYYTAGASGYGVRLLYEMVLFEAKKGGI